MPKFLGAGVTTQDLTIQGAVGGFDWDTGNQYIGTTYGTGGGLGINAEAPLSSTGPAMFLGGSGRGDANKNALSWKVGSTEYLRIDGDHTSHNLGYVGIGQATGAIVPSMLTVKGNIELNHGTSNLVYFGAVGVAAPAFTTRSAGTKLALYSAIDASNAEYAFGVETDALWSSVPTTGKSFKWYGGTTLAATLTGLGGLTLVGDLTVSGSNVSLNGATSNAIDWNTSGVATPTFTTRSAGTKLVLYPNITASSTDLGIGIAGATLWMSVSNTGENFKWYGGETLAATLSGAGVLTLADGGNIVTGTGTGMKIGTSTSQKLGFFNSTPVVKPTALTAAAAAAPAGGTGTAAGGWDTAANRNSAITTINNLRTRVNELETKLQALGLLT